MSLGGIAIAIGAMVDAAIIMIENAHKHLEHDSGERSRAREVIIEAAQEVGRPLFFSLLIITVSFLPIFTLEGAGGPALPGRSPSPRRSPWASRRSRRCWSCRS